MTLTIDLMPELETRLQQEAAKRGQEPSAVVMDALDRLLPTTDQEDNCIETGWEALTKLIEECQVDTGVSDLAHQHGHYLSGTPKREPYPPDTETQSIS